MNRRTVHLVPCCAFLVMGLFSRMVSKASAHAVHHSPSDQQQHQQLGALDADDRLRGALWAFFAGDALASPTHWYYGGRRQVVQDYGKEIEDYTKPNFHLAGSILNKSNVNGGGRSAFAARIMGKKRDVSIIGDVINHGKKDLWSPNQSIHYHATLEKGENTLEVQLARVLMKSIVANKGRFDPDHFRNAYVNFMTTPGSHNDTYASTCHRMFFANMVFRNLDPADCPDNDSHNVDTIDGLILPTIVALAMYKRPYSQIGEAAAACAAVTRKSKQLEQVASIWARYVAAVVRLDSNEEVGNELAKASRRLTGFAPNPRRSDAMTACYLGPSLPAMIDMVAKYTQLGHVWEALLANANVGGENVHRGSILGAVLGARTGNARLPSKLREGLFHEEEIAREIDAFVEAVRQDGTSCDVEPENAVLQ